MLLFETVFYYRVYGTILSCRQAIQTEPGKFLDNESTKKDCKGWDLSADLGCDGRFL